MEPVAIEDVAVSESMKHARALDLNTPADDVGLGQATGHMYTCQNCYAAFVSIKPVDGARKIIDSELLEETQIDPLARSGRKG